MSHDDLWKLDATAQAALVRNGDVSAAELVERAIARIDALNPEINAVITPLFDDARRTARDVVLGSAPFAGVPLLVKDANFEIAGTPYNIGTTVLRELDWRSKTTSEIAERFLRAGFIVLGKTNLPELSAGITTEPRAFGATHNPWDLTRTTGGSSGGSAAAVASGMVSVAHGGDATGSLRYPAACCGLVTLKPSRGRLPHVAPAGMPDDTGVWVDFVLARTVRDLASILDAVVGPGRGSPFVAPPPARPYIEEVGAAAERPLRVGLMTRDVMAGIPVDPECVAAVAKTGRALASLGHHVDEAHPPALDGLFQSIGAAIVIVGAVGRRAQVRWLERVAGRPMTAADLEAEVVQAAARADDFSPEQLSDAQDAIARAIDPLESWWHDGWDLLVTPTLRQPAWPLGQTGGAIDAGVFPGPFSFGGQPAMSLPLHWSPAGLPVGVQLVAAYGREDILFRAASQLETALPWTDRWPPIAAP